MDEVSVDASYPRLSRRPRVQCARREMKRARKFSSSQEILEGSLSNSAKQAPAMADDRME
jgi:hypothetical protein